MLRLMSTRECCLRHLEGTCFCACHVHALPDLKTSLKLEAFLRSFLHMCCMGSKGNSARLEYGAMNAWSFKYVHTGKEVAVLLTIPIEIQSTIRCIVVNTGGMSLSISLSPFFPSLFSTLPRLNALWIKWRKCSKMSLKTCCGTLTQKTAIGNLPLGIVPPYLYQHPFLLIPLSQRPHVLILQLQRKRASLVSARDRSPVE